MENMLTLLTWFTACSLYINLLMSCQKVCVVRNAIAIWNNLNKILKVFMINSIISFLYSMLWHKLTSFIIILNNIWHICRFFSPTINYLTSRGHNVHILCLSTGNNSLAAYSARTFVWAGKKYACFVFCAMAYVLVLLGTGLA